MQPASLLLGLIVLCSCFPLSHIFCCTTKFSHCNFLQTFPHSNIKNSISATLMKENELSFITLQLASAAGQAAAPGTLMPHPAEVAWAATAIPWAGTNPRFSSFVLHRQLNKPMQLHHLCILHTLLDLTVVKACFAVLINNCYAKSCGRTGMQDKNEKDGFERISIPPD